MDSTFSSTDGRVHCGLFRHNCQVELNVGGRLKRIGQSVLRPAIVFDRMDLTLRIIEKRKLRWMPMYFLEYTMGIVVDSMLRMSSKRECGREREGL